jgi:hypothetical protein
VHHLGFCFVVFAESLYGVRFLNAAFYGSSLKNARMINGCYHHLASYFT